MVTGPRPALDLLPTGEVVALLLDAEQRVVPAVRRAADAIASAADLVSDRLRSGGRLAFAGAGTSGRIAAAEAAELPGTFGLDRALVPARVAGGAVSTDHDEDDVDAAARDAADLGLTAGDVLVAVAASGSTPYTLAVARAAVDAGAAVIGVVTVAGSPLSRLATVPIEVRIGDEVLRGSTRLCAGTAQKVALNTLTTAAMARFGRVHGDHMIDVEPANAKLRARAAGIVTEIADCSPAAASAALERCGGNARAAVLHLALGLDPMAATARSAEYLSLRAALESG